MTNRIEYNPHDPDMKKAFDMAEKLSLHCKRTNLPKSFVIMGVAWNYAEIVDEARKAGIAEGKAFEKGRIAQLLGVIQ